MKIVKRSHILFYIVTICFVWSAVSAKKHKRYQKQQLHGEADVSKKFTQDLSQQPSLVTLLPNLAASGNECVQRMWDDMRFETSKLDETFKEETMDLSREANEKLATLRENAHNKSKEAFTDYAQEASKINDAIVTKISHAQQKAGEKLLSLFDQALRKQQNEYLARARQKIETFQKTNPQNAFWKIDLHNDFVKKSSFIENIILSGESENHVKQVIDHVKQQESWFDKTLANTRDTTDPSFYQLVQKNAALDNVVKIHIAAENRLRDKIAATKKQLPAFEKIRLMLLYNVNSFIQHKGGGSTGAAIETQLSEKEMDYLVEKTLSTACGQAVSPATLEKTVTPKNDALDNKNRELEGIILDYNQKLASVEKQLAEIQSSVKEEKKCRLSAEYKADLVDDMYQRRYNQVMSRFDLKKTLIQQMDAPQARRRPVMVDQLEMPLATAQTRRINPLVPLAGVLKQRKDLVNRQEIEQELVERMAKASRRAIK